ncbi:unnamed protein product [Urochloa decumbens]|uniref:Uncharacterized protein n=1 Tax=Urochloa decumbens TaxID=240449 RepID=A0ABC8VWI8_9POAL
MAPNPSAAAIRAAFEGNLSLLKELASEVDLREAKHPDGSALYFAAAKGHLEVCRFLVEESGVDVNCTNAHGMTPVFRAAAKGEVSVLQYLLDHGGDPAIPDALGFTPLHIAAENGHFEAIRLLLSKGVDADPLNNRLVTPLHTASTKGYDQAVKLLLERGADPNRIFLGVMTPLLLALHAPSLKCVELLIEAGANVNFIIPYGPSALIEATMNGLTDIVKFLLEAGADPNIFDNFERNPIMYAAKKGRRDLVEILFPHTKPIASVPNWSIDGIISTMEHVPFMAKGPCSGADAKIRGNEAFAKGDYPGAIYFYAMAMLMCPLDATLFANRSLCWLRLEDGEKALSDAQKCRMIRPHWSKAWYREGAALRLLKNYKGATDSFAEALKLDPASEEIKAALREAIEALKCAAPSEEQNA